MRTNRSQTPEHLRWVLLGGVIGTAVGGTIGAAAGMLLATKTGREISHLLTEKRAQFARRAQDLADGAQDRPSDWLDRGRAADWLGKRREIIEEQARRLAAAVESRREHRRFEVTPAPREAEPKPEMESRREAESTREESPPAATWAEPDEPGEMPRG